MHRWDWHSVLSNSWGIFSGSILVMLQVLSSQYVTTGHYSTSTFQHDSNLVLKMFSSLKDLTPCFSFVSTFGPDKPGKTHTHTPHTTHTTHIPPAHTHIFPSLHHQLLLFYLPLFFSLQDMYKNVESRPTRPSGLRKTNSIIQEKAPQLQAVGPHQVSFSVIWIQNHKNQKGRDRRMEKENGGMRP